MARGGGRRLAARGADELASELEGGPRPTSAPACSSRSASSSTWSCNPTNFDTAVSHLHPAGVKVFAYVRTCYGGASCPPMYPATYATDVNSVWGYIQNAFSHGADGVFLDEATSDAHSGDGYYSTLYDDVHTNYPGKQVIINPGVAGIAESTLSVSDIVSVECQWASFNPSWKTTYDAKHFMGLDGCDPTMTASTANTHAQQARANHVGYFYATDHYTDLPSWYETYFAMSGTCTTSYQVTVNSTDLDNNNAPLNGLCLYLDGSPSCTAFTPATLSLGSGTHTIKAANYQNDIFSIWSDGETSATHSPCPVCFAAVAVDACCVWRTAVTTAWRGTAAMLAVRCTASHRASTSAQPGPIS